MQFVQSNFLHALSLMQLHKASRRSANAAPSTPAAEPLADWEKEILDKATAEAPAAPAATENTGA